jgi:hypothetical protein
MRQRLGQLGWICLFALLLFGSLATDLLAQAAPAVSSTGSSADEVKSSLNALNAWLGKGATGEGWRKFLETEKLSAQLALGSKADKQVVFSILSNFDSKTAGLDRPQFAAVRNALADWLAELSVPAANELPAFTLEQKTTYKPLTDAQVAAGKKQLQDAVRKLGKYLPARSKAGAGWRKHLQYDDLAAQLKDEAKPDLKTLVSIFYLYTADTPGLEHPEFTSVADALSNYIDLVAVKGISDAEQQYEKQLEALAVSLKKYTAEPNGEEHFNIGRRLGELTVGHQGGDLVSAVRKYYSQPNLFAEFSQDLIEAGMARAIDRNVKVSDSILGASIWGSGRMQGNVTVELIPDTDKAVFETVLKGRINTHTTGSSSGVTFNSRGVTGFHARKRMMFDEHGLSAQPTRCSAVTDNNVYNVSAGRIASNIAWGRIADNRAQSNLIAAQHAKSRINDSFEREAAPMLAKNKKNFNEKFRHPLIRTREFPELLHFSSTAERIKLECLKANRFQIGAPEAPPEIAGAYDMTVRMHQSFPDNMATAMFGGKTMTDEQMKKQIVALRGSLPDEMKNDENEEPWSITFARHKPITISFDEGEFEVTIRGQQFTSGDREFKAMNISARYRLELTATGTKMVRQGIVKIEPPDFAIKPRKLSASEITLRTILERKFARLFKEEILSEGLELPGAWKKAGKLKATSLNSSHGWLSIGWQLPDKNEVAKGRAALDTK